MKVFIVISTILVLALAASNTGYCRLCANHVACRNSGAFHVSCPRDRILLKIAGPLQDFILDYHNRLRSFIAVGAENNHKHACRMATMQWDDELAMLAEFNVKRCTLKRDYCIKTRKFPFPGQNLGYSISMNPLPLKNAVEVILDNWSHEIDSAKPENIESYQVNDTKKKNYILSRRYFGHFTLMVNDHNTRVGCAASRYSHYDESNDVMWKTTLLACNYATTNTIGSAVYDTNCSRPAIKCQISTEKDIIGLCSPEEPYDFNKLVIFNKDFK
ncbi:antigen 5 like allergen Cul n 1-like [Glossina fuscipes fuscipes]